MGNRLKQDDYVIGPASRDDIPALLELQNANQVGTGAALSVQFSSEWFERSMDEMPIIVAKRDGVLVGYLVSPEAYNSGPLCVAASERGRGLAPRLFHAMRAQLPGREAVTFIRRDNSSSRTLHRKLAFREIATFTYSSVDYLVAVHRE